MSSEELRDEVVGLAQALVRLDTSNPPGRETVAAELLADYLRTAGAECELVGPDPDRLNLVARVRGADGPSLMFMAHTDVVPAPADGWSVGPFAGELRDGVLMGRGAADMKGELASRTVALAALARGSELPAGDVVLVAESDEERNTADVGMSWLVRERPDLHCDYAINEGAGSLLELTSGQRVVTVSVGEKKVSSLRIRIRGTAGHASVPASADNPLRHASQAIERLLRADAEVGMHPATSAALRALGAPDSSDEEIVAWAGEQHPVLATELPAMTRMTVTPTGLHTYEPPNVIPPYADLVCDCRALPEQTEDDIMRHVRGTLGDDLVYETEFLEPLEGGTQSPIDTPLYAACERYVETRLPGTTLLPLLNSGFTDSHWVRRAHGTTAYGFAPIFHTDLAAYLRGIHGADECIHTDDLVEMTAFNLHAVRSLEKASDRFAAGGGPRSPRDCDPSSPAPSP